MLLIVSLHASASAQLGCELTMGRSLDKGSANHRPQDNSSGPPIFVNKVLLEFRHSHSLHIIYGYFCATRTELNRNPRRYIAHKP